MEVKCATGSKKIKSSAADLPSFESNAAERNSTIVLKEVWVETKEETLMSEEL